MPYGCWLREKKSLDHADHSLKSSRPFCPKVIPSENVISFTNSPRDRKNNADKETAETKPKMVLWKDRFSVSLVTLCAASLLEKAHFALYSVGLYVRLSVHGHQTYKKLCYREEHSASVFFRWSTLSHLLGKNLLMANQPLSRNGLRKLPNWAVPLATRIGLVLVGVAVRIGLGLGL